MNHRIPLFLAVLILLLAACEPAAETMPEATTGTAWPTDGWQTSTPEQQGLDPEQLSKLNSVVEEKGLNLHSLLIIRSGRIVFEQYYGSGRKDSPHVLYSVTKSFVATLVGIALDQGKVSSLDSRVLDLLPGRAFANSDPSKEAMTLDNLLTMTSGLAWQEGDPAYTAMYRSSDWVDQVMGLTMLEPPGQTFNYCSGCSHILAAVLDQAIGGDVPAFARKNLFEPLGIKNYQWEKDRQGIPIGGWGLELTSRDMAKLGYLYLRQGQWEDQQIVSPGWVQAATQKHVPTDGRLGYGYQWWIYPDHGAYTALGRDGQTIFVIPRLDMVIVTTAAMPEGHDPIFDLIDNDIIPAVKDD